MMTQIGLSEICDTITSITEKLKTGEEKCRIESNHSIADVIEFLTDFVVELKELDARIAEAGNTPELLQEVYNKYTELWLLQIDHYIESLPKAIGALMNYANQ